VVIASLKIWEALDAVHDLSHVLRFARFVVLGVQERHVERCVPRGLLRFDWRGAGVLSACHIEAPEGVHAEASAIDPGRFGSWPPDVLL
jgi:hypothetical protein